ncbi:MULTISPECIES: ParA family protein [unclassified Vibrio]|uniref:ParA family protein n=1 Tax=unclassified Vibrio TaxID=2614977 RepID=UPI000C81BF77|nr:MULTISPECIES: ParA family protein [unclassified Vibrio]PMK84850.1 hypothetical protein BCT92_00045 [Vibrio sp. 10N.261.52.E5]TKF79537.1 ParA family protein [Vibrio sp. F13]CAH7030802.1 ParA family protein [Vibrio chagasii]
MNFADKVDAIGRRMKEESVSLKDSLRDIMTVEVTDEELPKGVSRLIYNHCLNKTEVYDSLFEMKCVKKTYQKKLDQAIADGHVDEPIYHHRKHLFTRAHLQQIMQYFEFEKYSDFYESFVVIVSNYKGGTGKSTTAVTLATKAALDLDLNAKVCLLDLDPQGSAARGIIQIDESREQHYITIADLQCYDLTEEQGDENQVKALLEHGVPFEQIVLASVFNTHLPNLDVMTAFPTDEKFSDYYMASDEEKQVQLLSRLKKEIIPILKSKYDIIILDLPPQNSPIVWSALEAANGVLTPISPKAYDYASTESYLLTIGDIARNLPSGGGNISYFRVLPVNYNEREKHERKTFNRLLRSVRDDLVVSPIYHSPLFLEAASLNRTIYDIKKSESNCTAMQYDEAISSSNKAYKAFIDEIKIKATKG